MNKLDQKEAKRLNLKTKSLERFVKSLIPLNIKKFLLIIILYSQTIQKVSLKPTKLHL